MRAAVALLSLIAMNLVAFSHGMTIPNSYGCTNPGDSKKFTWCDATIPLQERVRAVIDAVPIEIWMDRMNDRKQSAYPNASLGTQFYSGPEAPHGIGSVCLNISGELRCATTFPSPPAMAASFNESLWYAMGEISSVEQRSIVNRDGVRDHNYGPMGLLARGPVLNINNRDPRWGRNHNSPSSDPVLTGLYGAAVVRGMQGVDDPAVDSVGPDGAIRPDKYVRVWSELKHAFAYNIETNRFAFMDSVRPQDMDQLFLPQFEYAIRAARPVGAMAAYPAYNRTLLLGDKGGSGGNEIEAFCGSAHFSQLVMRSWGFGNGSTEVLEAGSGAVAGYIESDCSCLENIAIAHKLVATKEDAAAVAVNNGSVDLNCGSVYGGGDSPLAKAHADGKVSNETIRRSAGRVMQSLMLAGGMDGDHWQEQPFVQIPPEAMGSPEHAAENLRAARQGVVLLDRGTNADGSAPLLPLDGTKAPSIVVIGPWAQEQEGMVGDYCGWVCVNNTYGCLPSLTDSLQKVAKLASSAAPTVQQFDPCGGMECRSISQSILAQAKSAAASADVVVLALGTTVNSAAREGHDKSNITLLGMQPELSQAVLQFGRPTVAVVLTGEALSLGNAGLTPVPPEGQAGPNQHALLYAVYPGMVGGIAVAEAIFDVDSMAAGGLDRQSGEPRSVPNLFGRMPFELYPVQFIQVSNMSDFAYDAAPGRTYRFYDESRAGGVPLEVTFGAGRTYGELSLAAASEASGKKPMNDAAAGSVVDLGCANQMAADGLATALSDASSLWDGAGSGNGSATTVWPVRQSFQEWPVSKTREAAAGGLAANLRVSNDGTRAADAVVTLYAVPDAGKCGVSTRESADLPTPKASLLGFQRVTVGGSGDSTIVTVGPTRWHAAWMAEYGRLAESRLVATLGAAPGADGTVRQ